MQLDRVVAREFRQWDDTTAIATFARRCVQPRSERQLHVVRADHVVIIGAHGLTGSTALARLSVPVFDVSAVPRSVLRSMRMVDRAGVAEKVVLLLLIPESSFLAPYEAVDAAIPLEQLEKPQPDRFIHPYLRPSTLAEGGGVERAASQRQRRDGLGWEVAEDLDEDRGGEGEERGGGEADVGRGDGHAMEHLLCGELSCARRRAPRHRRRGVWLCHVGLTWS